MNDHASKRRQGAASEAPRLVLRAVLRGLGVYRIRGLDRLDVVVISPGGVGSTLLIDQLAPHLRVNSRDDADHLKHLPRLPDDFPPDLKIIFIHGEIEDVVQSIRRRGWVARHGSKLASVRSVLAAGEAQIDALRRAIAQQIAWFSGSDRRGILKVRYEELWDRLDEISAFLGIDADAFRGAFPPQRPRTVLEAETEPVAAGAEV
jgi:hypothetical protein